MTTAPDLLPPAAPYAHPHHGGEAADQEDEDEAGYAAMMSELPTIVSMSGLLDGDFDELNEIQNLLAPVSDDDEEGKAAASSAAAAAEAAEDAYIQAMVPNPIPTGDFMTGMDVSATAAALDENLGFPSTALITPPDVNPPAAASPVPPPPPPVPPVASSSLSVKAPTKRVHSQLGSGPVTPVGTGVIHQPLPKKAKATYSPLAKTPATLRTSLDGVSAPNPLLFGRPIQIPSQAQLDRPSPKPAEASPRPIPSPPVISPVSPVKVALEPRAPLRPTRPPRTVYPPVRPTKNLVPPKPRIPPNPLVPEIISSYPVPAFVRSQCNNRPPLCKVIFRGKIYPVGSIESPIARVPAPPITKEKQELQEQPVCSIPATCNENNSATASKKKASNNKKKKPAKIIKTKKAGAIKAKKAGLTKPALKASAHDKSTIPNTDQAQPKPQVEELMVANPLANVPPAAPFKFPVPPKSKTPTAAPASSTPPAEVSSDNSACSDTPEDMASMATAKPSSSRPATAQEKAQACRDRNRQHARNTRLRKKAYVEELKRSLMDLVEQRDRDMAAEQEEKTKKQERRVSRKRALEEFLRLRGQNERDEAKWAQLVKDSKAFQLTLPTNKYQAIVHKAMASDPEQVLVGIQDAMADASYFASFLQSLGTTGGENEDIQDQKSPVYLQHQCDDSPLLLDGTTGILCWKATTCGAVCPGTKSELQLSGSIRAAFCSETDKLLSATLAFDTGVIQAQLSSKAPPQPPAQQAPHV